MTIGTGANIGDCIWLAIMLSKLPGEHVLYVKLDYVAQLRELVTGTLIRVESVTQMPPGTQDGWIANGRFESEGLVYRNQIDILGFVRAYMNHVACAGRDLIPNAESFLCDFPAPASYVPTLQFDILALNCNPLSGQCPGYSGSEFDGLLSQLQEKGHRIQATNPTKSCPWGNFTLAQIAYLSTRCGIIIGVASGPLFPTFNIWNKAAKRYVFLDPMRLDYGPNVSIKHAGSAEEMRQLLVQDGYL